MHIILIGYRCTGKTSAGKAIAEKLGCPFYDTDVLITDRTGQTIKVWVEKNGWDSFRLKEKEVIKEISLWEPGVIALGGGAILDPENREVIKKNGRCIWLTTDIRTILGRMQSDPNNQDNRPSLSSKDMENEIRETLAQRSPLYQQLADYTVDTTRRKSIEIAEELCTLFEMKTP